MAVSALLFLFLPCLGSCSSFFTREERMESNLEAFLDAATPQLMWRSETMERFHGPNNVWQLEKKDAVDYFTLEDLWEHYSESSAYGLPVPVRLETGEIVTQHFAPYLSAIQMYTTKALAISCRGMGRETDSCSDDSMGDKFSRSWDVVSDDSSHDDSSYSIPAKQSGYLSFQYKEWRSPYERVPLAAKVAELAQDNPFLTSLKSAELSPSSWMSVAWYPIYHIPAHGNQKGISACFLTYHSISSVFQESNGWGEKAAVLSPFGLATQRNRMEGGDVWASSDSDRRRMWHLLWAAASWLKQVRAHHPDFTFFTSLLPMR